MAGLTRGDLKLLPGGGCVVLARNGSEIALDLDDLRWLMLAGLPAALARRDLLMADPVDTDTEAVLF